MVLDSIPTSFTIDLESFANFVVQDVAPTLVPILGVLLVVYIVLVYIIGPIAYANILKDPETSCDIDTFVSAINPNPPNKFKVAVAHRLRMGYRKANLTPIPLECTKSPHVKGLYVSRRQTSTAGKSGEDVTPLTDLLPRVDESSSGFSSPFKSNKDKTVVVATIRMGFGHHRLAYSACSWALNMGYTTIFHDLLNIDSDESKLLTNLDQLYSKFSRLASEIGGPVEKLWGMAMTQGNADALRLAAMTTAHLQPLLLAYPKDIPLICTHQTVALTAAAAGFTNVINLVVDNYPQWFLVVPKMLNVVQGPVNYQSFLRMGVSPNELRLAGHWCPTQLVSNIKVDCERRITRAKQGFGSGDGKSIAPRRLLVPVGGAGAQRSFILGLIGTLKPLINEGKIQLLLNAGDHKHMKTAFIEQLKKCDLDYELVSTTQGVFDVQAKLLKSANTEPTKAVTLFAFDEYFPAVATTDILCRVADVLTCKPSELAFYPIPKLHIRRVGDHEADSAKRSSELGDGTIEARELTDAKEFVDLFLTTPDLLVQMNEMIIENNTMGRYSGCKNCVDWVMK